MRDSRKDLMPIRAVEIGVCLARNLQELLSEFIKTFMPVLSCFLYGIPRPALLSLMLLGVYIVWHLALVQLPVRTPEGLGPSHGSQFAAIIICIEVISREGQEGSTDLRLNPTPLFLGDSVRVTRKNVSPFLNGF